MAKRRPRGPTREELEAVSGLVAQLHEHGACLATRTIYLGSELFDSEGREMACDARMAEVFLKNMHALEALGDEPVKVIMNNPGGNVYHGLAIYDAIACSPLEVTVVVRGHAMSMGSWILQAADRRVMGPSACQMIHYGTDSIHHHAKTVWKQAQEGERLHLLMEACYLRRIRERHPDFRLAKLREMLDHDTFLTAEESVELGLADEIG